MTADNRHFYLRRIHSLLGVVPVGVFLLQHIYANFLAMWGPAVYDEHVHFITHQPLLVVLEIGGVFAPLAAHALLGVYFMLDNKFNPAKYPYARNIMYTLQRITAWITLFYVVFHVVQTRFTFSEEQKELMYNSMVGLFDKNKGWLAVVYGVGVVAASFHLCNGFFTFCIVWGITISKNAQKWSFRLFMGLFLLMSAAGIAALLPLTQTIKPPFVESEAGKAAEKNMGYGYQGTFQGGAKKPAPAKDDK
ncbi:MAG: succinate dehydrogenase [Planctomycetes bacterium]|nr:succinate dehydrogenase [Planctomycetota bacterium]